MITNAILLLIYIFILAITSPLTLLSDVAVNSNVASAITSASGYISSINIVFPVTTILLVAGAFFAFEIIYGIYKIIKWVYQKIPMVN